MNPPGRRANAATTTAARYHAVGHWSRPTWPAFEWFSSAATTLAAQTVGALARGVAVATGVEERREEGQITRACGEAGVVLGLAAEEEDAHCADQNPVHAWSYHHCNGILGDWQWQEKQRDRQSRSSQKPSPIGITHCRTSLHSTRCCHLG